MDMYEKSQNVNIHLKANATTNIMVKKFLLQKNNVLRLVFFINKTTAN